MLDGALVRLELARAYVAEAKSAHEADADAACTRALNAYKEFLELWKDAAPAHSHPEARQGGICKAATVTNQLSEVHSDF